MPKSCSNPRVDRGQPSDLGTDAKVFHRSPKKGRATSLSLVEAVRGSKLSSSVSPLPPLASLVPPSPLIPLQMPYIHSQPSTSTSHLLSSQHHTPPLHHNMESPTSYRDDPVEQLQHSSSTSTDSPAPLPPTGLPSVTLPPPPFGIKQDGASSIYAPRLRSAVKTLQAVRAATGSRYDWASSGPGAE